MSNKFTQEEYQKIVELHDKRDFSVDGTLDVITYFVHNRSRTADADINMALAIANPRTRELAHDKFVEKEKKYVWQSKQQTDSGKVKRLYDAAIGITDSFMDKTEPTHNGNWITETEVKKWGYNPEMFDKEEV